MTTDGPKLFDNARELIGFSMAKQATKQALTKAGIKVEDVGVV
jgi:3-oxoacyl-[acyl-carrier-protein] synthase III